MLVPDWSGSESDFVMIQAGGLVEFLGIRKVEFDSPIWRTDKTFRGWPSFWNEGVQDDFPPSELYRGNKYLKFYKKYF